MKGVKFDKPVVILCEGHGDRGFLNALTSHHQIGDGLVFCVPYKEATETKKGYAGGRTNFGDYLSNISTNEGFLQNVRGLLIVSDNDADKDASFREVCRQITLANFKPPTRPQERIKQDIGFQISVLMLPIDELGCLETLCLKSAYCKWPEIKGPLDTFVDATAPATWTANKQDKMRVQTLLSATNESQPDTGFGAHWNDSVKAKYRIPVDHACFDGIVTYINSFRSSVAEPI